MRLSCHGDDPMTSPASSSPKRRFELDSSALVPGSATAIELGGATSADIVEAVLADREFPRRPIDFANFSLETEGQSELRFPGSGSSQVAFSGSAEAQAGIFDTGSRVLEGLAIEDSGPLGLTWEERQDQRYFLLLTGYQIQGRLDVKHPIGVIGSASLGVEAQRSQRFAIVHRFAADRKARSVLQEVFSSWKLPRQIVSAEQIAPGTDVIVELEGALAIQIGARLGYDFSFVRESAALGLQGDVGLKLEAGVKAAIGLQVSGRYLLVLSRETEEDTLRLRVFKLNKKGLSFGFNLAAAVEPMVDPIPDKVDDLVKAVFGLHGQQVVKDLLLVEKWTDPESDLSETVAGLVNKTGMELLEATTGLQPKAAFDEARAILVDALKKWENLPPAVSSLLWSELEGKGLDKKKRERFTSILYLLSSTDLETRTQEIVQLLSIPGLENEVTGRFLVAATDGDLSSLLSNSEPLHRIASLTLDVLNGGVVERLQSFVSDRLSLDQVLNAVEKSDFDQLDGWLIQRLSQFFDESIRFEELDKIKDTIGSVVRRRQEIYDKARQALARRYDVELARNYQRSTAKSALLNVTFDTTLAEARGLLSEVMNSHLDRLFTRPTPGVTLAHAVLTHQLSCQSSIEVQMPFYNTRVSTLTQSLARVSAQEDGGRVLFYELSADDTVIKNRLKSQLAVAAAIPSRLSPGVRQHTATSAEWSYKLLQVSPQLRRPELEQRLSPIILEYFPDHFSAGGRSSLSTFLTDFDRAVEDILGHPTDEFGDLLFSLDVSLPASAMTAWFRPRNKDEVKQAARAISLRTQRSLQHLIPFYYLRDLSRLHQNSETSPLLVFAALPATCQFQLEGNRMSPGDGPIWDVFDPTKRKWMSTRPETISRLGSLLAVQRARLLAAGCTSQADFFRPDEVGDFLSGVSDHPNFINLLRLTSVIGQGAENALKDLRDFDANADSRPSKAIERLARFGADVVTTFNKELGSIYGTDLLRPLGSLVFIEAACALDPAVENLRPNALLSLTVLREQRQFKLQDFLLNQIPEAADVAVQQRLVSVGS